MLQPVRQNMHNMPCDVHLLFLATMRSMTGHALLLTYVDFWMDKFDCIGSAHARKLSALAACQLLTLPVQGLPPKADILLPAISSVVLQVWVSVLTVWRVLQRCIAGGVGNGAGFGIWAGPAEREPGGYRRPQRRQCGGYVCRGRGGGETACRPGRTRPSCYAAGGVIFPAELAGGHGGAS